MLRWGSVAASFLVLSPLTAAEATFYKDIAPIVYHSCAPCHRPGQPGPFPLLTYADVRKRGPQIVTVTRRRYMPPWLPEAGYGDFADERRLTDAQIQVELDGLASDLAALETALK